MTKCLTNGCNKYANFNYNVEKNGIYCKEHKLDNMVDVKNKRCVECDKQPAYNFSNEKSGIYCSKHRKNGMINVVSKRCNFLECVKQPYFNFPNEKRDYIVLNIKKKV